MLALCHVVIVQYTHQIGVCLRRARSFARTNEAQVKKLKEIVLLEVREALIAGWCCCVHRCAMRLHSYQVAGML